MCVCVCERVFWEIFVAWCSLKIDSFLYLKRDTQRHTKFSHLICKQDWKKTIDFVDVSDLLPPRKQHWNAKCLIKI